VILLLWLSLTLGELTVENLKAKIIARDGPLATPALSKPTIKEITAPVSTIKEITSVSQPVVQDDVLPILPQPGMQVIPLPAPLLKNSQLSVPSADSPLLFSRSEANSAPNSRHDVLVQTGHTLQKEVVLFGLPLRIWISGAIYMCLMGFAGIVFSRKPIEAVFKVLMLFLSTVALVLVIHDRRENVEYGWKLFFGISLLVGFLLWNIVDMIYLLQGPLHSANLYFKDLHWETFKKRQNKDSLPHSPSPKKSIKPNTNENWSSINNQLIDALNSENNKQIPQEEQETEVQTTEEDKQEQEEQEQEQEEQEEEQEEQEQVEERQEAREKNQIGDLENQYENLHLNLPLLSSSLNTLTTEKQETAEIA